MRIIAIITISVLFSCSSKNKASDYDTPQDTQTINDHPLNVDSKDDDTLPKWLIEMYPSSMESPLSQDITEFYAINDSVTVCVTQIRGPVGSISYLATHKNRIAFQDLIVGHNYDHEQSYGDYSYIVFERMGPHLYKCDSISISAHDSLLDNYGRIVNGLTFDEIPHHIDTTSKVVSILPDGTIAVVRGEE